MTNLVLITMIEKRLHQLDLAVSELNDIVIVTETKWNHLLHVFHHRSFDILGSFSIIEGIVALLKVKISRRYMGNNSCTTVSYHHIAP